MTAQSGIATTADGAVERWMEGRGIDPETVARYGITSGNHGDLGECVVFPFFENGKIVNHKYRGRGKDFRQDPGARKTFWNADAIKLSIEEDKPLLITEGEMDALSAIEAGYPWVVSVPDGAPAKAGDEPVDPENDRKYEYIWNNWDTLKGVKTIILAGDGDEPGQALNQEMVRRFGVERCRFVEYPVGKDLNDVLLKAGKEAVLKAILKAKEYPVSGLYKITDFPDAPVAKSYSTGFGYRMDSHFRVMLGTLLVITGVPNHGKSEFVDALIYNLIMAHQWPAAVGSFETPPVPYWRDRFRQRFYKRADLTAEEKTRADAIMDRWIRFIAQNTLDDDDDFDLEQIIRLAEIAVIRDGMRILLLDPWNQIEHKRRRDETETDYVGRALKMLRKFARRFDVLVIIVAHPYKMSEKGKIRKPNLYDISGSANWFNIPDQAIVIWRDDLTNNNAEVSHSKRRFEQMGKWGIVPLTYDTQTREYKA